MTASRVAGACALCDGEAIETIEPPRRTFARGTDPTDAAYSVIAVLPDIALCEEHAEDIRSGEVSIGWCDDERCRRYGESGEESPCGQPYQALRR